jgi:hypothetical protein
MSLLNTSHPRALQSFLTETLFDVGMNPPQPVQVEVPVPLSPPKEIPYYGKNGKNILFLVSRKDHAFFSEAAELAFLKTLQALQLELNDVAVVNLQQADQPLFFEPIRKQFEPRFCVFLGAEPTEAGLEGFADHLWTEERGVRFLKSYSFEEMLTDKQKKRMFWDAIKLIKQS